jgi:phosphohistidine swiveling domain-containing protein
MKRETIYKIKKTKWHADWGGPTPLLDVSFAPALYFSTLERKFGKGYSNLFVIYKKGIAQGFLPEKEYKQLGTHLAKKIRTVDDAKKWAKEFMEIADKVFAVVNLPSAEFLKKWEVSGKIYGEFGAYAEATKNAFKVLDKKLFKNVRNILAISRKYSEKFYAESFRAHLKIISKLKKPAGYKNKDLLMMTRRELIRFTKKKKIPPVQVLKNRFECCGIYFSKAGAVFLDKKEVEEIEASWIGQKVYKKILGTTAFKGKVIGKCRVIKNFANTKIKTGDILVTGMTDPSHVLQMKKAGAIITDGGGLLSHAAIVARELKKPCIIGTKIATQVLKDGDLVEVDANRGVVKIIKKA